MKITTTAFSEGAMIPRKYTCQGEDIGPPLQFSDVPKDAQSLALEVRDPDAPGGDFVHWIIWNIDPKLIEKIDEGTTPIGAIEGTTDFGRPGWGGPRPPSGKHRYEFHLYVLSKPLSLPHGSDKDAFRKELEGKVIEKASLTGVYEKN